MRASQSRQSGERVTAALRVQLKKGRDGPSTLACVRSDGSRTWGKVHPFFPVHDLTHCAVESVLRLDEAFFGLLQSGWEIDDFAARGVAARLPPQAILAECIVGMLDLERANGRPFSTRDFGDGLALALAAQGLVTPPPLTEPILASIRRLRDQLEARWLALQAGDTLEVEFPAVPARA